MSSLAASHAAHCKVCIPSPLSRTVGPMMRTPSRNWHTSKGTSERNRRGLGTSLWLVGGAEGAQLVAGGQG